MPRQELPTLITELQKFSRDQSLVSCVAERGGGCYNTANKGSTESDRGALALLPSLASPIGKRKA